MAGREQTEARELMKVGEVVEGQAAQRWERLAQLRESQLELPEMGQSETPEEVVAEEAESAVPVTGSAEEEQQRVVVVEGLQEPEQQMPAEEAAVQGQRAHALWEQTTLMMAFETSVEAAASFQWVEAAPCLLASSFLDLQLLPRAAAEVVQGWRVLLLVEVGGQKRPGALVLNLSSPQGLIDTMTRRSRQCRLLRLSSLVWASLQQIAQPTGAQDLHCRPLNLGSLDRYCSLPDCPEQVAQVLLEV